MGSRVFRITDCSNRRICVDTLRDPLGNNAGRITAFIQSLLSDPKAFQTVPWNAQESL